MRFQKIFLKAFGHFTDETLDLDTGEGLHIILGSNEAGKTTVLHALSDMLFGFEHLSSYDFLHEARSLRIGAEIESMDGQKLAFLRRKGRKDTLLDLEENPIEDTSLAPFTGTINRQVFERRFGLNHERLRAGGREILKDSGDAGFSLFEAGSGVIGLRRIIGNLEEDASALFRPRGSTQLVNRAIKECREARNDLTTASLSRREWQRLDKSRAELEADLARMQEELEEVQSKRDRLERIGRNRGDLLRRSKIIENLKELKDIPKIRQEAADERKEAEKAIGDANIGLIHIVEEKVRLQSNLDDIDVPDELLAVDDDVGSFYEQRGEMRKGNLDLPKLEGELGKANSRIASLLEDVGLEQAVTTADKLADGRADEAARLEQYRSTSIDLEKIHQNLEKNRKEEKKIVQRNEELNVEWQNLWQGVVTEPASPKEMAEWLDDHDEIMGLVDSLGNARIEAAALNDDITGCRSVLIKQLTTHGEKVKKNEDLATLRGKCRNVIKTATAELNRRVQLSEQIEGLERHVKKAERDHEASASALSDWWENWAKAIKRLGRPAESSPEEVEEAIGLYDDLRKELDESGSLLTRINGIKRDVRNYEKVVSELADKLDMGLSGHDAFETVNNLNTRLTNAKNDLEKLNSLRSDIERNDKNEREAKETLSDAKAVLRNLCAEYPSAQQRTHPLRRRRYSRQFFR